MAVLDYQIPFVYSRPVRPRVYKSATVPGMATPMSVLVDKFLSGQVVGLSSYQVYFDDGVDEDNFELSYFPDPNDPLAYEQATLDYRSLREREKRSKKEKTVASKLDDSGNASGVNEGASATT